MPIITLPMDWRSRVVAGMRARAIGRVEVTANRGQLPDYLQSHAGGSLGEYYCMDTVCVTFADVLGHASPLILSGSCSQQRIRAKARGALIDRAEFERRRTADPISVVALIMLVIDASAPADGPELPGHAHHTGTVGDIYLLTGAIVATGPRGGFLTIEGNASNPKAIASANGDGIYPGRERGHQDDHTKYEFIDPAAFVAAA